MLVYVAARAFLAHCTDMSSIHILSLPDTPFYLLLGRTSLPLAASIIQPPIRHSPPIGVTGPTALYFFGSQTRRYMLPENIAIPAVKRLMASVFAGATTAVSARTAECMSCSHCALAGFRNSTKTGEA